MEVPAGSQRSQPVPSEEPIERLGNAHAPLGDEPPADERPPGPREYADQGCCANCVISTALAAILCRKGCDVGRVISEFAFFPPDPPTYAVPEAPKGQKPDPDVPRIDFNYRELDLDPSYARFRRADGAPGRASCRVLETKRGQRVPSFYFRRPGAKVCVVYLHANATDCGAMLPTYAAFARRLDVHVLAGEYSGYGAATGEATPRNVEADALALYDEALRRGHKGSDLVLYGQSVGSAPACYVAARRPVRGVVLHSPVASGIRALVAGGCCSPVNVYACLDPFNNLREVSRVDAPVFVVHGTADEEIPWEHGKMLYENAKRPYDPPYWVEGAGHNNLLEAAGDELFVKLAAFLKSLEAEASGGGE